MRKPGSTVASLTPAPLPAGLSADDLAAQAGELRAGEPSMQLDLLAPQEVTVDRVGDVGAHPAVEVLGGVTTRWPRLGRPPLGDADGLGGRPCRCRTPGRLHSSPASPRCRWRASAARILVPWKVARGTAELWRCSGRRRSGATAALGHTELQGASPVHARSSIQSRLRRRGRVPGEHVVGLTGTPSRWRCGWTSRLVVDRPLDGHPGSGGSIDGRRPRRRSAPQAPAPGRRGGRGNGEGGAGQGQPRRAAVGRHRGRPGRRPRCRRPHRPGPRSTRCPRRPRRAAAVPQVLRAELGDRQGAEDQRGPQRHRRHHRALALEDQASSTIP